MRRPAAAGQPVVVKIGSSSLSDLGSGLNTAAVQRVVGHVNRLRNLGHACVLVTSGAVAAGLPALGMKTPPHDLPGIQVAAAVGQSRLVEEYGAAFASHALVTAQVLLTKDVLARRTQYLHARQAMERMLALDVVPIVNENDTVVFDELKMGDNDRMAAIVSHLVGATMLVILTDTAGLFSSDPRSQPTAELLANVGHTDKVLDELWGSSSKGVLGSGGVATKIAAARMAAWSAIPTVIAPADAPSVLERAVRGEDVGTWVNPRSSSLTARKLWIAFGTPVRGRVAVDNGAREAIVSGGKSLLAVGVTKSEGDFGSGDSVEVIDSNDLLIATGIARITSRALTVAPHGELIHRDDLVVLTDD